MEPHRVLGIPPAASLEQAEIAYRRLLKQEHPDRHHAGGAAAVQRAEWRTRELNQAIELIRARADDPWLRTDPEAAVHRSASEAVASADPPTGAASGRPPPPGRHQCPYCEAAFADPARFIAHTSSAHQGVVAREIGLDPGGRSWFGAVSVPVWLVGSVLLVVALARDEEAVRESPVALLLLLWLISVPLGMMLMRRYRRRVIERHWRGADPPVS